MSDIVVTEKPDGTLAVLFPAKMSEPEFYDMYDRLHGDNYCVIQFRSAIAMANNRQWIEMTWQKKDTG